MSARTRQPAKKQTTANTNTRERDRDPEVKLQRQRLHDSTRELDIYIRNVISRNDMELYPPPRLRTSENVGAWWNNYIHERMDVWVADANAFFRKMMSDAKLMYVQLGPPVRTNERRCDYFIGNKRVGMVIIRNDARNPLVIEIKE
jgi:hypothetical protein